MTIPTPAPDQSERQNLALLRHSGLFDTAWFEHRNPDLLAAGIDPLLHYHRFGWREGRRPNAYFDTTWYLATNRDVAAAEIDPLLHYVQHGEAEGRRPVEYFDAEWYRAKYGLKTAELCLAHFLRHRTDGWVSPIPEFDPIHYLSQSPDVAAAKWDPFEHYLVTGASEAREPSPSFDVRYYQTRYLRHLPNANPLLHYRRHRHEPGIFPTQAEEDASLPQLIQRNTQPGPLFEKLAPLAPATPRKAKLLAFYLPQFHPVPENDRWWGDGFTEWTNVARGVPRFAGHYQPRIPRDLGHYRLDNPGTLARQINLAKGAGIHGFVFYFYWFNGQRLLDRPLEDLLADPALAMPFCLMWANENWTRRWDGSEHEILLSQDYRDEDEPALIATFARHFDDPRYLRLERRPVLMVYRASLIPGAAASVRRWRRLFQAAGHDPVFVMAQSFGARDPAEFGMDAAVEFPPHKLTEHLPQLNDRLRMLDYSATARVFDYDLVANATDLDPPPYKLIRTALPGWDNDARRQGHGMTIHGATPAAYQAWLSRLIDAAAKQPVYGETIVCINAWNEWAEGAYLEPDVHFGGAFLNATSRAAAAPGPRRSLTRLLLVGHDAFAAGSQLLLLHIGRALQVQDVEVTFLLLAGGSLEAEYRALAPTSVFAGSADLARHAADLAASGFQAAICNTSATGAAVAALSAHGIACTLLLHEMPRLLRERRLIETARAGVAAAKHIVFAAAYVRDRYHELVTLPLDRTILVPQGLYRPVDRTRRAALRTRLRLPEGATLAVGLGYADLRKGFDLFLQAWRQAHAADPAIHFLWVGDLDPVISAYLGVELAAAAATGTFHHLPFQAEGADWLAAADIHLLTSREDPFPSVVLEAMAAGTPTIAFDDSGGAPDLLRECRAGRSVPLADIPALVREILVLRTACDDQARLASLVRERFPFPAYARSLLRLTMPPRPRISAVVPTLNYARYLPARLSSIFAQTLAPDEILVLDDGSTDRSQSIVRKTAKAAARDIVWIPAEPPAGVFAQWRRAAARGTGDLLWIAEADDLAEPTLLARLAAALQQAPDACFAFADSTAIGDDGQTLWPDHKSYYVESGTTMLDRSATIAAPRFLREALAARNLMVNASAVLWRRKALIAALDRAGPALDTFRLAGDWLLYAEAAAHSGTVAYVADPLNHHRRHRRALSAAIDPAIHLEEIRHMHRRLRNLLGDSPALLAEQRRAIAAARRSVMAY